MSETISSARPPAPPAVDLDSPQLYINRELSLLEFQRRVLEEAQDARNPLLERVRFLAIVGSNLDEFFMVRVAGLKQQIASRVQETAADGMTPSEQLTAVRKSYLDLMRQSRAFLRDELMPALAQAGVHLVDAKNISKAERNRLKNFFDQSVFPVLTPLAVDPGRPFPHISNLSVNLAVMLRAGDGRMHYARVKVPDTLPQLVPIPSQPRSAAAGNTPAGSTPELRFAWLYQVVAENLDALFPGMEIQCVHPFRVTRNSDVIIQEIEASDLLETVEEGVRLRQFGIVTRVSVNTNMPEHMVEWLATNLEVSRDDVYAVDGPLGLSNLMPLYGLDRPDLKEPPYLPVVPAPLDGKGKEDLFDAIRREDILLHHPFDSFVPVVDFLRKAAVDPDVMAIKMTLYRVGRNSPVVQALLEARENGTQVAVLVELKARFDEERNIEWARALESEGVHVVYGLLGLKTHSKVALVVRREGDRIRRYVHLSTGNYNTITAQTYTDMGFFTCDEDIGADVTDLFNYLTGYSAKEDYRKLLVAPINLRERLDSLIDREIQHQERGARGHLIFKMNALVDRRMIQRLYRASQAGVQVDLLVRGICCLRPGVPGVSENIRVTSIVGRFLEHSRIYYFRNGGQEEVVLGSADLMPRNINGRVEVLFPVSEPRLVRVLRDEILATYLADNVKARMMQADGTYVRLQATADQPAQGAQATFMRRRSPPKLD